MYRKAGEELTTYGMQLRTPRGGNGGGGGKPYGYSRRRMQKKNGKSCGKVPVSVRLALELHQVLFIIHYVCFFLVKLLTDGGAAAVVQ